MSSGRNCTETEKFKHAIKVTDKSFTARWYCTATFDLFFPEPEDAPHIVFEGTKWHLFDVDREYLFASQKLREAWSKIFQLLMST